MTISVIIPVLNEAEAIAPTLASTRGTDIDVIVVDGGSQDGTVERVRDLGFPIITSPPGRANQMNAGAAVATGEILLFLHADTRLPAGFDQQVRAALGQREAIAGAFHLKIDSPDWRLRLVEWGVGVRSRCFQLPYGDQAIFLKASLFRDLGGFSPLPIMEDFELVCRLRRQGRVDIVPPAVLTSSRRWDRVGIWRTTWVNQGMVAGYFLGVAPARLVQWYRRQRS